jgi:hypothetical protein
VKVSKLLRAGACAREPAASLFSVLLASRGPSQLFGLFDGFAVSGRFEFRRVPIHAVNDGAFRGHVGFLRRCLPEAQRFASARWLCAGWAADEAVFAECRFRRAAPFEGRVCVVRLRLFVFFLPLNPFA